MSKSLGNFFTIRDLLDQGVPGEVIRFVFLSTHYRKPMDWTAEKAKEAEATLRKWRSLIDVATDAEVPEAVVAMLSDDLNTAGAIAELHKLASAGDASGLRGGAQVMGLLTDELGEWAVTDVDLKIYAERLCSLRDAAMQTKDFAAVDTMKTALLAAGVEVRMSKAGVDLVAGADFDASKLEALL